MKQYIYIALFFFNSSSFTENHKKAEFDLLTYIEEHQEDESCQNKIEFKKIKKNLNKAHLHLKKLRKTLQSLLEEPTVLIAPKIRPKSSLSSIIHSCYINKAFGYCILSYLYITKVCKYYANQLK